MNLTLQLIDQLCETSGFHGRENEDDCHLACCAVQFSRQRHDIQRCLLPSSLWLTVLIMKAVIISETSVNIYQTRKLPEDRQILKTSFMLRTTKTWMNFQVLMAVSMNMVAFWDAVPCSVIEVDPTFQRCVLSPSWGRWVSRAQKISCISSWFFACSLFIALMTETVSTSEISIYFNETSQCYIPESCHLLGRSCPSQGTGFSEAVVNKKV
jgi:hypothetical protein